MKYGAETNTQAESAELREDGLDDQGLQAAVAAEIRDAIDYIEEQISPARAKATKYYNGEPFGTEQEGLSQHVSTDVRDTVLGLMPSLMRIFAGSDKVCEYGPVKPEDVPHAEQATDVVHHIFYKDNPGFSVLYSAFKDALVRKMGIVKWWHEEIEDATTYTYSGLDMQSIMALTMEPDVEVVELEGESDPNQPPPIDPETGEPLIDFETGEPVPPPMIYRCEIRRISRQRKYCVAAVPPEEFVFDRRARDLDSAALIAHRQLLTVSDLVAMGYDREMVEEMAGAGDDELETNEERYARNPQLSTLVADRSDEAAKKVLYIEAILKYDRDGDGIAERLKVCTIGNAHKVVHVEGIDEVPYAIFEPDPEPHTLVGLSEADKVLDIQETKSEVMRGILDSLAQSIHPRTGVVEGQVNMDDVLNNETGAVIRMRVPGAVQPFTMPFVGQAAFPVMAYLDEVKENRTGVSKAAQGLNADALQSSTRAAVAATISAAQSRVELIARIFAETGLKRLFRGLLKLIIKHQDQPMVLRLRGQFVPVDPRVWNADMDVEVNVALSAATTEERLQTLAMITQKQEQLFDTMGPNNPLVTPAQYRNTLAKQVELAGFRDPSAFFNELPADFELPDVGPEEEAMNSPEGLLAQAQLEQIRADIQKKAAELELDREKMLRVDDRERDRLEIDRFIRLRDIELKYQTRIDEARLQAEIDRDREIERAQQQMVQQQIQQQMQPPEPPPEPPMTPEQGPIV